MHDVANRLELFVDDWLIERIIGAERRLHQSVPQNVAVPFDKPWEGSVSFYVTVFKDSNRFRAYYRGQGGESDKEVTAYAESHDGVALRKPDLAIFEWCGSKANNIVWAGEGSHNFTPFRDENPAAPREQRYKALAGCQIEAPAGSSDWRATQALRAFVSPDGLHWQPLRHEPVITEGAFDSQNLAFWDTLQQQYVAYARDFRDGVRHIRRSTSKDFLHWTFPEWLDFGDAPLEHLYTNAITPYFRAPHIYLGFPKRFVPDRKAVPSHPQSGLSDSLFMVSRDGLHWHRFREAFIRPGLDEENWTERNIGTAWGVVPTGEGEISIYWVEHYRHPTCRLRRGTLRTDGFVSINAPSSGGEVLTRPFTFSGKNLIINFATSAAGSVQVELQDQRGKPLPGLALEDCPEIYGDRVEHVVRWRDVSNLASLVGRPVRLRFLLKDADLYALRFQ